MVPRRALVVLLALGLAACAELKLDAGENFERADYWDSGLVYHRYIDVAMLPGEMAGPAPVLSGFVSAVAVNGNAMYFIDQGVAQLVEVDLATMTARPIAEIQSPLVNGLYADDHGKIYVIDRARREVLVLDRHFPGARHLPLAPAVGNPLDVAVIGDGQWLLVLDALEGRVATLDTMGAVSQIMRPELPAASQFITAKAIAASGNGFLILDGGADQVIGFDLYGRTYGVFAEDDLSNASALAADSCGRFFVADANREGLYLGFSDMSLPGRRVSVPELAGADVTDLWTDGVFLYVATRADGIHVLLLDPACGEL